VTERPNGVTERDIERVLGAVAGAARVFRLQMQEARPWIEVLTEDYAPGAALLQSFAVAEAERPMYLGTARHIEQAAVAILRDLRA
jgi:hypothetical protein